MKWDPTGHEYGWALSAANTCIKNAVKNVKLVLLVAG